jgi:hypothetical protein
VSPGGTRDGEPPPAADPRKKRSVTLQSLSGATRSRGARERATDLDAALEGCTHLPVDVDEGRKL